MRKLIVILASASILCFCNSKKRVDNNCRYSSVQLLREFDSTILDEKIYSNHGSYEISDKGSNIGVKGIYKFDSDNTLRFYAFLLSGSNDYTFSRQYDSLGMLFKSTGGEVTQWYFRKVSSDSSRVTFFLYGLNQTYSNLNLQLGSKQEEKVYLVKSPIFSNILGGSVTILLNGMENKNIYIRGKRFDKCLGREYNFIDSTQIPSDLFDK